MSALQKKPMNVLNAINHRMNGGGCPTAGSLGERAYTAGKTYIVKSMHPIALPAYVVTEDDQGKPHRLEATDIRRFFLP